MIEKCLCLDQLCESEKDEDGHALNLKGEKYKPLRLCAIITVKFHIQGLLKLTSSGLVI